jgi:hypothetical protein
MPDIIKGPGSSGGGMRGRKGGGAGAVGSGSAGGAVAGWGGGGRVGIDALALGGASIRYCVLLMCC